MDEGEYSLMLSSPFAVLKRVVKGTDRIWGNHEAAPDDPEDATDTHGRFFSFRETTDAEPSASQAPAEGEITPDTPRLNLTMNEAGEYILTHTPNSFQKMMEGNYSNGFETDVQVLKENARDHRKVSIRGVCWGPGAHYLFAVDKSS